MRKRSVRLLLRRQDKRLGFANFGKRRGKYCDVEAPQARHRPAGAPPPRRTRQAQSGLFGYGNANAILILHVGGSGIGAARRRGGG